LLLQQRSKHPRGMVITPKASTSILVYLPYHTTHRRFIYEGDTSGFTLDLDFSAVVEAVRKTQRVHG